MSWPLSIRAPVLALLLAGCIMPAMPLSSFVKVPADASCRKLSTALRESGVAGHQYLTLEETWIVHRQTRRGTPAREWYPTVERPLAWGMFLRCGDDPELDGHQIPVRTCVSRGRMFGVIDPQYIRALYPDLSPGAKCWLTVWDKRVGGRWTPMHFSTKIQPNARPMLFSDPTDEASP